MSKTSTFVSMQSDGTLVRIKPDGTEEKMVVHPPTPLSDEEITAAALRDPDAQPLTEADLARMKRVPRIKTLRRALGLTQEEFAARYCTRSRRRSTRIASRATLTRCCRTKGKLDDNNFSP